MDSRIDHKIETNKTFVPAGRDHRINIQSTLNHPIYVIVLLIQCNLPIGVSVCCYFQTVYLLHVIIREYKRLLLPSKQKLQNNCHFDLLNIEVKLWVGRCLLSDLEVLADLVQDGTTFLLIIEILRKLERSN